MTRAPLALLSAYFRSFSPAGRAPLSRRSYVWETRAASLVPMSVACVEGNVLGVLANKAFLADAYVVAAVTAAGPIGLLSSPLWARVMHRRDRVRLVVCLQLGVVACVAALALAPFDRFGVAILVAATYLARFFQTGVVTARSDLWRANYPRDDRARATGAITIITTLVFAATSLLIAQSMDMASFGGNGFRYVYAGAIGFSFIGIWCFSRVRWRGRAAHLAIERGGSDLLPDIPGPRAMVRVLKRDRLYRRFMAAQFILGVSNLAAAPLFIVALEDVFTPRYTRSIMLTQIVPIAIPIIVIPLWARFLDSVHIIRFRAYHSWTFVLANALLGIGMLTESEPIVWASRIVLGVAFGGGMLAWSLGHHDFATRELAGIYMGIHATLTGVRGFLAPFFAIFLYTGVAIEIEGVGSLVIPALGSWMFIILAGVGAAASLMFARLLAEMLRGADRSEEGTGAEGL